MTTPVSMTAASFQSLTEFQPQEDSYKKFTETEYPRLREALSSCSNPPDIQAILEHPNPSPEDTRLLESYCKAKSTIAIWTEVVDNLSDYKKHQIPVDFPSNLNDSSQIMIAEAEKFSAWCEQHAPILKLYSLKLDKRNLTHLPKELKFFPLIQLNLSHNFLTEIPPEICSKKLQRIDLSHNKFRQLPDALENTQLIFLDLSHNQFTEFPEILLSCLKLNELNLEGNQIPFAQLPAQIGQASSKSFYYSYLSARNIQFHGRSGIGRSHFSDGYCP